MTSGSGSGSKEYQANPEISSLRSGSVLPTVRSAPTARLLSQEEIHELRKLPYERYLHTRWWFARRNQKLRDVRYRCETCDVRRNLQVHHLSYERLGAELDDDLQVLCRDCHLGHHFNQTQEGIGVYRRVLSAVLAEGRFSDPFDVIEEAKCRLFKLRIPHHAERFHAAVNALYPRFPFQPRAANAELYDVGAEGKPLTRAEAAGILSKIGIAGVMKHMPEVKPLTRRAMDYRRAAGILAQAIIEQVRLCEDLEAQKPE